MTDPKPTIKSLAGQTLGDETATDRERRLAGAILHQAREDQESDDEPIAAESDPTSLDALQLRRAKLQAKLSARSGVKGNGGYSQNLNDIETALAEINAEIDRKRSSGPEAV